jgi:hypothetical protein
MTLTTLVASKQYAGNGSATTFPTTFRFFASADLRVLLTDTGGADTEWMLGTEYTVTGAGDEGGGTVVVSTTPTDYTPAVGETLTIIRETPQTQEFALPLGGPLPSTSIEQMVDRTVAEIQETTNQLSRKLGFPDSDSTTLSGELPSASTRADKFLAFGPTGEPIAAAGTSANLGPVSAFIDTLLDDADAATARTTLGAEKLSITTQGDLIRGSSAGVAERLGLGSDGEVVGSDGTDLVNLPHPGLASVQVFTASDTWTKPAGVRQVLVKVVGGGGGAGGADSNGASRQGSGGGAGGAMAVKLVDVTGISSATITVGGGGAGGTVDGGTGGTGGDSIWADGANTVTGTGGGGGAGTGSAPTTDRGYQGGAGATATGGDVNTAGQGGDYGFGNGDMAAGGVGGSSPLGGGGRGGIIQGSAGAVAGSAGGQYGGGGGGSANRETAGGVAGGAGAAGVVIVWEYQ